MFASTSMDVECFLDFIQQKFQSSKRITCSLFLLPETAAVGYPPAFLLDCFWFLSTQSGKLESLRGSSAAFLAYVSDSS